MGKEITLQDELLNLQIGIELDKMYVNSYDNYIDADGHHKHRLAVMWGECFHLRQEQLKKIKERFGLSMKEHPHDLLGD